MNEIKEHCCVEPGSQNGNCDAFHQPFQASKTIIFTAVQSPRRMSITPSAKLRCHTALVRYATKDFS